MLIPSIYFPPQIIHMFWIYPNKMSTKILARTSLSIVPFLMSVVNTFVKLVFDVANA